MNNQMNKEDFLKDVANHQLTILKDDGIYRHIHLGSPNTNNQSFEIVTWPGYLSYSGDMGCFVFSRLEDMFRFFRDSSGDLKINTGYWSEKLHAVDSCDGYKKFSWDSFVESLMEFCETEEQKKWMNDELEYIENDEFGAVEFYRNFDNDNDLSIDLSDFFECTHSVPTQRYLWCCYALVWAIKQYDLVKQEKVAA